MPRRPPDLIEEIVAGLPLLLTRKEAAELLRCSPGHISHLINENELQAVQRRIRRTGSRVLIPKAAIRRYLERVLLP